MKRFLKDFSVFVLLAVALFFAATVVFHESPQQTWGRIVHSYNKLAGIKTAGVPAASVKQDYCRTQVPLNGACRYKDTGFELRRTDSAD